MHSHETPQPLPGRHAAITSSRGEPGYWRIDRVLGGLGGSARLGVMGEQRLAEAARSCLNGGEVSTLLGRKFKESVWLIAGVVSMVVMRRSNNTDRFMTASLTIEWR